jgi:hypothetical protein
MVFISTDLMDCSPLDTLCHGLKRLDSGQAGGGKCSVETARTLQQMKAFASIMDSTLDFNASA